ncbi:hypothetical protein B484DRAFT_425253 [Ochromonadaceae sp. CCMP2298]|nr:hypothetical protein B484DRAFT_425253 [Ochromonadaceae sp. CCMP2298]|mmetsp:Transcript_16808/g.37297  ORF Transcript_16808/g.37297 Transcript_16808/m.37297 type:complete len:245 (+) Transcript_16808:751-1485(+)
MYLTALLMHFRHWPLMSSASWAVVNLCQDNVSGNRSTLGRAYAGETLVKGLSEFCSRNKEYTGLAGFAKLVEHYAWALLNVLIGNEQNQRRVRMLHREEVFDTLQQAPWVSAGAKDKIRRVVALLSALPAGEVEVVVEEVKEEVRGDDPTAVDDTPAPAPAVATLPAVFPGRGSSSKSLARAGSSKSSPARAGASWTSNRASSLPSLFGAKSPRHSPMARGSTSTGIGISTNAGDVNAGDRRLL